MTRWDRIHGIYRPMRRRQAVIAITPELLIRATVTLVVVIAWLSVQLRMWGAAW